MNCEYCGKILATKVSLLRHQKTVKYCLVLQEKTAIPEFKCDGCGKCLSNKYNLSIHKKGCKVIKAANQDETQDQLIEHLREKLLEKDAEIQKLEKHIESLQDKLVKIAMRTTKTTTNITTNIQQNFTPITNEKLAEDAAKLTIEHLTRGGEAIAGIFLEGSLKKNAICTDVSRRVLHHKNEEGEIIKDFGCDKLTKRAFSSIFDKAREIKNKCGEEIDTDDDDQIERLGKVMNVVGEISETIAGKTTEVSSDFAKAVCLGST